MKRFYKIFLAVALFLITPLCFIGCGKYTGEISNLSIEGYETTGISFFVDKNASYGNEVLTAINTAIDNLGSERINDLITYHNNVLNGRSASLPNDFPEIPSLSDYSETLVAYHSVDDLPFGYQGVGGAISGVEIDVLKFAADILHRKLEVRICTFSAVFTNVCAQSSEWRVSGIAVINNAERRNSVAFSKPMYETKINIISKQQDSFSKLEQLNGKKIGVYIGEVGAVLVHEEKDKGILNSSTQIIEYTTAQTAFQAFLTQKIDVVVCADFIANGLISSR